MSAVSSPPDDKRCRVVYWWGEVIAVLRIDVTQSPYNAPSDGLSDAGPAVASALAALAPTMVNPEGGGVLYFPAGTYWMVPPAVADPMDSPFGLTVAQDNVHVEGDGIFRTILTIHEAETTTPDYEFGGVVAFAGISTLSANDVSIRDVALVGATAEEATGLGALVFGS